MVMRKVALILLAIGLMTYSTQAQSSLRDLYYLENQNQFLGGLGVTWIDNQPYTTLTLAPEFAFGKFGIGLYLQLLMDQSNGFKLRTDEYKDGAGILRAIRYVRWGLKNDPFYIRVGMLDRAMLANGFLLWNYNNGSNYDKRKIGLALDVDMGNVGFESVVSNLVNLELIGVNAYVRPVRFFAPQIPVLNTLRLYVTYVRDQNLVRGTDSTATITAYGIGADLKWLDLKVFQSFLYADWGKFQDYGSGAAVGIRAEWPDMMGLFGFSAKFERRFINDQFVPSFFGPLYDLNRKIGVFTELEQATESRGYFGQLAAHVVHKILIIGNFQRQDDVKYSGRLHLEATAPDLIPKFQFRFYYDKTNIESFTDARTLDINSVATAEVGYKLNSFLLLSTLYRWYWIEQEPGVYKPVERIEPRLMFTYSF